MTSFQVQDSCLLYTSLRVLDEIKRGVQTIQYQVITLMTTNGQAPFVTVYMDLSEDVYKRQDYSLFNSTGI